MAFCCRFPIFVKFGRVDVNKIYYILGRNFLLIFPWLAWQIFIDNLFKVNVF